MTSPDVAKPSRTWVPGFRGLLSVLSVVVLVLAIAPPMWGLAHKYEFVQAIQFCLFGFAAPALWAVGAPWLGVRPSKDRMTLGNQPAWFRRWNSRRVREKAQARALTAAGATIAATLFWRVAPIVNALIHHPWLIAIEALTLFIPSTLMMVELVESPPLTPGISRPYRIGMAAVAMWTAWVVAYLGGMSHDSWYTSFHHVAGAGISASADQQLSAGFVWFITASVFVPIVFWNLIHWLQSEEDPNEEIIKLFRQEREHGFFGSAE